MTGSTIILLSNMKKKKLSTSTFILSSVHTPNQFTLSIHGYISNNSNKKKTFKNYVQKFIIKTNSLKYVCRLLTAKTTNRTAMLHTEEQPYTSSATLTKDVWKLLFWKPCREPGIPVWSNSLLKRNLIQSAVEKVQQVQVNRPPTPKTHKKQKKEQQCAKA